MRKIIISFSILIVLVIILFSLYKNKLSNNNELSNKIMEYIDNNIDNNACIMSMKDLTDFKWDKMLIYLVGSSNAEISEILGVEFEDSIDLSSGMIFIYENKIVYKESMFYNPEQLSNRLFYVNHGQPQYIIYTPSDAMFEGGRKETGDNSYYYTIVPSDMN